MTTTRAFRLTPLACRRLWRYKSGMERPSKGLTLADGLLADLGRASHGRAA